MLPSKRVFRTLPVQLSKTENLDFKKDVKFNSNSEETALLGFLNSLWILPTVTLQSGAGLRRVKKTSKEGCSGGGAGSFDDHGGGGGDCGGADGDDKDEVGGCGGDD